MNLKYKLIIKMQKKINGTYIIINSYKNAIFII